MVRVRVVVVAFDLPVTRRPIELKSLPERLVGIKSDDATSVAARDLLELLQQPAPDAESPGARRDPHALDLCDPPRESSYATAAYRRAEQSGDE